MNLLCCDKLCFHREKTFIRIINKVEINLTYGQGKKAKKYSKSYKENALNNPGLSDLKKRELEMEFYIS